ncbi:MAG: S-layer homology domain-containing protein [Ruminococcaceae bacterium]|nr:S-layer homology domain-containing protein [Oscillospiraceae bacterium]
MVKKLITVLLITVLAFGSIQITAEEADFAETVATQLQVLGLFRGTDRGFELDREMTRAEAITMLIRALGEEEKALKSDEPHGFTDVPSWANRYVSHARKYGLTSGISDTEFGSDNPVTAREYLTFLLRALGYSDAWQAPFIRAADCEILLQNVNLVDFCRRDAVMLTAATLFVPQREPTALEAYVEPGTDRRLFKKLIEDGVFTEEAFAAAFPQDPFPEYRQAVSMVKNAIMERENTGKLEGNVFRDDLCFLTAYSEKDGILQAEAAVTVFAFVNDGDESFSESKTTGYKMEIETESGTVRLWEEEPAVIEQIEKLREGAERPYEVEAAAILGYDMMLHNRNVPPASIDDYDPQIIKVDGKATYEESIEMLEKAENTSGISERWEGPECTACLTYFATPHGGFARLYLVFKADAVYGEGKVLSLPLPEENIWGRQDPPDTVTFSEDGKTLTYTRTFEEKAAVNGGRIFHEKGTYTYTVDTENGTLQFALIPLAE